MKLQREESKRDSYGLAAAFSIAILVIVGGIYLIDRGHDWAGISIISVNLIGLVSTFIYRSLTVTKGGDAFPSITQTVTW